VASNTGYLEELSSSDAAGQIPADLVVKQQRLEGYAAAGYDRVIRGENRLAGWQMLVANDEDEGRKGWRAILMLHAGYLMRCYSEGLGAAWGWAHLIDQLEGAGILAERPLDTCCHPVRVDVAVDHWGMERDWRIADLGRFATASKARGEARTGTLFPKLVACEDGWTWQSTTGTTFYVGKRGPKARFLRIYDKIAEARKSGKVELMAQHWEAYGWDGKAKVWRAEIEHGSEWLKDHGFKDVTCLHGCEGEMWRHYSENTRHTTGGATRVRRASTSETWKALQKAGREFGPARWAYESRPPRLGDNFPHTWRMTIGCIRSLARVYETEVGEELFPSPTQDNTTELQRCVRVGEQLLVEIADKIRAEEIGARPCEAPDIQPLEEAS
jgi:hypothetical protein